jgi:hypothetical protein
MLLPNIKPRTNLRHWPADRAASWPVAHLGYPGPPDAPMIRQVNAPSPTSDWEWPRERLSPRLSQGKLAAGSFGRPMAANKIKRAAKNRKAPIRANPLLD